MRTVLEAVKALRCDNWTRSYLTVAEMGLRGVAELNKRRMNGAKAHQRVFSITYNRDPERSAVDNPAGGGAFANANMPQM